jgi:hypothetical protein
LIAEEIFADPGKCISELKQGPVRVDLLIFPQKIDEPKPKHAYPFEWDNAAAARTENFTEWWEKLPQETRKNVRKSGKKGVTVQAAKFDDEFVKGIKGIFDESPVRQGMKFWHYGEDLEKIKMEQGKNSDRSEFIGAYYQGELIGFIKFVKVGRIAKIMQILAKNTHQDKRPMNALIAKAVEVCHEKGMSYLVYSKFTFGNKKNSALTEFKRRNGFDRMVYPRYCIPLTLKGRIAIALKLHRGLLGMLPSWLIELLLRLRSDWLQTREKLLARGGKPAHLGPSETTMD